MASLIEGFGYDIFISYRQKDNKGDKWVSEFVEALKSELDSTIKDEVSIYFDENPHDGLLETHDVDASLREKLRCLVFIPVISKTYCDQRSFAWVHEFMAFVEAASSDGIGLRVKLPNGNVACRVLPVRIHEIEADDTRLCETILGGNIRGIDFIYKSAGVNRPLRINEDYPQNNQNKTYYRDQINKVANAIDEIFHALRNPGQQPGSGKAEQGGRASGTTGKTMRDIPGALSRYKSKLLLPVSLILIALAAIIVYNLFNNPPPKNTVAILPFRCQPGDPEMTARSDILAELARTRLEKIPGVTVRSGISTNSYRETVKPLKTIRKELDIDYLVDGTCRSVNGTTLVWINIVDARNDRQLWSEEFTWDSNLISGIAAEVAREFALSCNIRLTAEQLGQIERTPTTKTDAYLNFISANVTYNDAWGFFNTGARLLDSSALVNAIDEYTAAIGYDSLFAEAYARRAIAYAWGYYTGRLDSTYVGRCSSDIERALRLDPGLEDAMIARGFYYHYCMKDYRNALINFNRLALMNPSDYQPLFYMAIIYRKMGEWEKSQSLIKRVMTQNPQVPVFLTNIGLSYQYLHKYDSAVIYHQKAIDANPGWSSPYVNKIESLMATGGKTRQARRLIDLARINTGRDLTLLDARLDMQEGKYREALSKCNRIDAGEGAEKVKALLLKGELYNIVGDRLNSVLCYRSALKALQGTRADCSRYGMEAIAYAGAGMKEEALAKARHALELAAGDKMDESDILLVMARVLAMTGDHNEALKIIEKLLGSPSMLSVSMFKNEPCWKPLINTDAGKLLVAKYSD